MQHTRKAVAAVIGLVAALSLTACNGDDSALGGGQAGSTASADKAGGTGGSGGSGGTGGTGGAGKTDGSGGAGKGDQSAGTGTGSGSGGAGKGKVDMCRSGVLDAAAVDNTTDETNGVVTVTFKNVGGADCRINGFPGVDIKTSLGDTFSVDRNGERAVPEILKEGETAAFNITYPVNNTGGSGVKLTDMVVTPPNETKPFTLKWPAGTLPVTDGQDGGKMELSPVGKVSDSPAG
ncbi:DUF4232 domain-containing protein [Streptomyces termitum]